jgi:hypothetical protein
MARAASLGLSWLAAMAISVSLAYAMNMLVTHGVSTANRAAEPVPIMKAPPVGNEAAWITDVGTGCWLPDPSGRMSCSSESSQSNR